MKKLRMIQIEDKYINIDHIGYIQLNSNPKLAVLTVTSRNGEEIVKAQMDVETCHEKMTAVWSETLKNYGFIEICNTWMRFDDISYIDPETMMIYTPYDKIYLGHGVAERDLKNFIRQCVDIEETI